MDRYASRFEVGDVTGEQKQVKKLTMILWVLKAWMVRLAC